jgi:hypothetical protein
MKPLLSVIFLIVALNPSHAQDYKTAPLSAIIKKVSNSIKEVEADNKSGFELSKVSASFVVSKTTAVGAGINIWIFKLGRKVEKKNLHKITLDLAKEAPVGVTTFKKEDVAPQLTEYIKAVLNDLKTLKDSGWLSSLKDRTLTIELGLTISKTTDGGGGYTIGIFTLSAEASRNSEQGHTLILEFKSK